jgi:hypothetical protein
MKRWFATLMIIAIGSTAVRADVTVVQTAVMEGSLASMAGTNTAPKITTRIKGLKSRTDVELSSGPTSTIVDLVAKQAIVLVHDQKTSQIVDGSGAAASAPAETAGAKVESPLTATGKTQLIDGIPCDEYALTMSMPMSTITAGRVPPETAAMLKDFTITMKGSLWVAKPKDVPAFAAEYIAFSQAIAKSELAAAAMVMTGVNLPGIDQMMKAMFSVEGLTYQTVMDFAIDGGSGELAALIKQMGNMKITTKVTSLSGDPVSDDLFKVPEGYTVIK